ncbi:MAG: hypothetical protein BGO55_23775 [Sphingobacteriales bacterium 50-39]|nr:MAG: hypothetical protein BGO55_23775 [Sphingobacteriales bacterium 50-39]
MDREQLYSTFPTLYEKGHINRLFDIFNYVRRTPFAKDIGMRVTELNGFIARVETLTLEEIVKIASKCHFSLEVVMDLWRKEYEKQKEDRKRK